MTALAQYQRLESSGVWRPSPEDRVRDVVVAFGDATLILRDPRSEEPLSHWSLPAVTRLLAQTPKGVDLTSVSDRVRDILRLASDEATSMTEAA